MTANYRDPYTHAVLLILNFYVGMRPDEPYFVWLIYLVYTFTLSYILSAREDCKQLWQILLLLN